MGPLIHTLNQKWTAIIQPPSSGCLEDISSQTSCLISASLIKWHEDTVLSRVLPNPLFSFIFQFFLFPRGQLESYLLKFFST